MELVTRVGLNSSVMVQFVNRLAPRAGAELGNMPRGDHCEKIKKILGGQYEKMKKIPLTPRGCLKF